MLRQPFPHILCGILLVMLTLAGCRSTSESADSMAEKEAMMEEEAMMEQEAMMEEMADESMMAEEGMMEKASSFTVRIEDVSTASTLRTSAGNKPVPLSPGVYVVHTGAAPLFAAGEPAHNNGLEDLAEDGFPMKLAQAMQKKAEMAMAMEKEMMKDGEMMDKKEMMKDEMMEKEGAMMKAGHVYGSGVFSKPVGMTDDAPIKPGDAYEFTVEATPGQRLSFATMWVQSNDLFLAPNPAGIALFNDDGTPVSGNVTAQIMLWDAGTEQNEEPGVGANTKPMQGAKAMNKGTQESQPVRLISQVNDGFSYPSVSAVVRVTITAQ